MKVSDFFWLSLVCFVWGLNIVITRWVVFDAAVPPIFFAAIRFMGVAVVLLPFLRPRPQDIKTLFLISLFIGAGNFALFFMGLANAEASSAAVVTQLHVPFATLMSMFFLGETIGWRRGLGILLAFTGVVIISVDPDGFVVSLGLLYVAASAFVGSIGNVMLKKVKPIPALQMQAWIALFSFAPLLALSAYFEQGQWTAFYHGGTLVWLASIFAVIGVSVFGHGVFYALIKKYDVSLLSPLTIMTPIWGIVMSVVLLGDTVTPKLIVGAAIALSGVFVIAIRRNKALPEAGLAKNLGGLDERGP